MTYVVILAEFRLKCFRNTLGLQHPLQGHDFLGAHTGSQHRTNAHTHPVMGENLHQIERVFADAKEQHGMRHTRYTGLAQVTNWVRLKFAVMNLKKFAKRQWEDTHPKPNFSIISLFLPFCIPNPGLA